MLIIGGVGPPATPLPADRRKGGHQLTTRYGHPRAKHAPVEVRRAGVRPDLPGLDVGVFDGVDVDGLAVGVGRPLWWAGGDGVAAVEARGVVGGHRRRIASL